MRASQMTVDPPTPEDHESDRENENDEESPVESRCRIEGHEKAILAPTSGWRHSACIQVLITAEGV
jgi:hypothetical protein